MTKHVTKDQLPFGGQNQNKNNMNEHDFSWELDSSAVLPPTPGRTLNISSSSLKENAKNAKRRLELDKGKSSTKSQSSSGMTHSSTASNHGGKSTKPKDSGSSSSKTSNGGSSSKSKTNGTSSSKNIDHGSSSRPEHPPTSKSQTSESSSKPTSSSKSNGASTKPPSSSSGTILPKSQTKKNDDRSKERRTAKESEKERLVARQLKTQAWARILRQKQKLYIPHSSDPRTLETPEEPMEVEPIVDKENDSGASNVLPTTFSTTPVKLQDYNSIIKLMSNNTPILLSPLRENPRHLSK